jgi:hypothetical protein
MKNLYAFTIFSTITFLFLILVIISSVKIIQDIKESEKDYWMTTLNVSIPILIISFLINLLVFVENNNPDMWSFIFSPFTNIYKQISK